MNPIMTNEEFYEAWCNTPKHYAPQGYWDRVNEERKKHRYVGRKAFIYGEILECYKAEDDLVFFKNCYGEIIVSGNDVDNIKWIKN